jgi:hypothetical protein
MSDFWDKGFENALSIAGYKHDMIVIRLLDVLEKELPEAALMDFMDNESGDIVSVDLSRGNKNILSQGLIAREERLKNCFRSQRIDELCLTTGEDYVEALLEFFMVREKKR